jgi:hypothetical protein
VALVDRVQKILTQPAAEWPVIATEPATVGGLYTGYIIPLAAIPAIAGFVGRFFFMHNIVANLVTTVLTYVVTLISVYILGFIAASLAPSFSGTGNQIQGLKWAAYSNTASWVAGIFLVIPVVGGLIALLGGLYSLYLLWLGTVPMMGVPQEKAVGYAVVVIVVDIVVTAVLLFVVGLVTTMMLVGGAVSSGAIH